MLNKCIQPYPATGGHANKVSFGPVSSSTEVTHEVCDGMPIKMIIQEEELGNKLINKSSVNRW